jgi:hypothetical protein
MLKIRLKYHISDFFEAFPKAPPTALPGHHSISVDTNFTKMS